MSSTGRGAKRIAQDNYRTPYWCIEKIAKEIMWEDVESFHEPAAGDGRIVDFAKSKGCKHVTSSEISQGVDYFSGTYRDYDLILTNPPFSKAMPFLQKSLAEAKTVIYLLRLNFLGSKSRKEFYAEHRPSHLFVLTPRPSFVDICRPLSSFDQPIRKSCGAMYQKEDSVAVCECGNPVLSGTDSCEYAWFVWQSGWNIMHSAPGIYVL